MFLFKRINTIIIIMLFLVLCESALSQDVLKNYLMKGTYTNIDDPEYHIRIIKKDLTGDGNDDYLISNDSPLVDFGKIYDYNFYYWSFHPWKDNNGLWAYGSGIGSLTWSKNSPGIWLPDMKPFINNPVVISYFKGDGNSDPEYYIYELRITGNPITSYLKEYYSDYTQDELHSTYIKLREKGVVLDEYLSYNLKELSSKYYFKGAEDPIAYDTGKGDPGYRLFGPVFPPEGISINEAEYKILLSQRQLDYKQLPRFKNWNPGDPIPPIGSEPAKTTQTAQATTSPAPSPTPSPSPTPTQTAQAPDPKPSPTPTATPSPVTPTPESGLQATTSNNNKILYATIAALILLAGAGIILLRRKRN